MPKAKSRVDSVFGELTLVVADLWERSIELRMFGKVWKVSLNVNLEVGKGAEKSQILAYTDFSKRTAAILKDAEQAILEYYRSECGEYRSRYGIEDPHDERVPLIKSKRDLARFVELEGVIFRYTHKKPTFGLLFQCTWEEEHGLAVKFQNGQVSEVGFQDIVL